MAGRFQNENETMSDGRHLRESAAHAAVAGVRIEIRTR